MHNESYKRRKCDRHGKRCQITQRMYLPSEHDRIDFCRHDNIPVKEYSENESEPASEKRQNDIFTVNIPGDLPVRKAENFERCDLSRTMFIFVRL